VGLVSRTLEGRGIPTVTVSMEPGMEAPRVARVPFPYNHPMGPAGGRREVALAALELFRALDGPGEVELPVCRSR
jgi:D-proline reductase (dithiol) PrdB